MVDYKRIPCYSSMSKEVKAAFWYSFCNVFIKSLGLITIPLFTRLLTEEEYGTVSIYNGWRDIFLVVGTLNIYYGAYNNALIKYKENIKEFTSSMIFLTSLLTSAFVMSYVISINFWNKLIGLNVPIMMIAFGVMFTTPSYNFWMTQKRFEYEYKKIVLITIFIAFISLSLSILFVMWAEDNATAKIIGTELPNIFIGLCFAAYFLHRGKTVFVGKYWKFALRFSLPLIPHYLSGTILNQSDRIMISKYVSKASAGIYSVAYGAAFLMTVVTSAISNSLVPWMYKRLEERDYLSIRKRTNQLLVIVAFMLLFFILFVPEVITILAPSSYQEARAILPILVMSVFFYFLYSFFGTVSFYYEKTVLVMIASVLSASLNILLNYEFLGRFGYFVAAYTTLISYVIMTICHFFVMRITIKQKRINESIFDTKFIFILSVSFVSIGMIESLLYTNTLLRYFLISCICLASIVNRKKIFIMLRVILDIRNKR